MIAARALMNPTAQAAYLEFCLGLGRSISAVRVNISRRIGFVQKSIEFLTVMHARVGHVSLVHVLLTERNDRADNHLAAASEVALLFQMLAKTLEQFLNEPRLRKR